MPKYRVQTDQGTFDIETDGGPPSQEDIYAYLDQQDAGEAPPAPPGPQPGPYDVSLNTPSEGLDALTGLLKGAAKSVPRTILGAGEALLPKTTPPPEGFNAIGQAGENLRQWLHTQRAALKPDPTARSNAAAGERAGATIGDVLQFLTPGMGTGNALVQALKAGGLTAAQEGEIGPGAAITGALTGTVAKAGQAIPPILRERAFKNFVSLFAKSPKLAEEATAKLAPIAEELPVGTTEQIVSKLQKGQRAARATKEAAYLDPAIADELTSRAPIKKGLEERAKALLTPHPEEAVLQSKLASLEDDLGAAVKAKADPEYLDYLRSEIAATRESLVPEIKDPALRQQLLARAAEVKAEPISIRDLYATRQARSGRVSAAKGMTPGVTEITKTPKVQSVNALRSETSKVLHSSQEEMRKRVFAETGREIPSGKEADRVWSAWKYATDAMSKSAPPTLSAWLAVNTIPRLVGGVIGAGTGYKSGGKGGAVLGAAAGLAAANPVFWKSLIRTGGYRHLAAFMEAGNKLGAQQYLAAAITEFNRRNPTETPEEELAGLFQKQGM